MKIQILGTGCSMCKKLFEQAEKAVSQAGIQAKMEKVEKMQEIMKFGVPMTPALVVNGEVKSAGKIPETAEIVTWLMNAAAKESS
jgi:small redox-active disulfide protein 2